MSSGGNFIPLFYAVGAIFIIGIALSLIVSSFQEVNTTTPESSNSLLSNFINDGFNVTIPIPFASDINFNLNVFSIFGESNKNSLVYAVNGLSTIPTFILTPLIFILLLALVYGVYKMLTPT